MLFSLVFAAFRKELSEERKSLRNGMESPKEGIAD